MRHNPNKSALANILERQRAAIAARLSKYLLKADDVDDILQETFIEVLKASQKTQIKSVQAYLYVVARNLVFQQIRKQSRILSTEVDNIIDSNGTQEAYADNHEVPALSPSADSSLYYKQALQSFIDAADSLPSQCRRVLLLRKVHGMSHKEISKKLGISTSTVERHITNGMTRCVKKMEDDGFEFSSTSAATGAPKHQLLRDSW